MLLRHGNRHSIPPHKVNYRANIMSAKKLGITHIIATSAVGSMKYGLKVGDFVVLDQFIDFTKSRPSTFFEKHGNVVHVDVSSPYSKSVCNALIKSLQKLRKVNYSPKGTYVCSEGPRYETAAEIKAYRKLGGDVVGMTSFPEVVLARELGIEYGTIAVVTNLAAGMQRNLNHSDVVIQMNKSSKIMKSIIDGAIANIIG
jgi:5'-methylthioadenosine phosphorylase